MNQKKGRPSFSGTLREAWFAHWARPFAAMSTMLIVTLVSIGAFSTAGRASATENAVLQSVDSLGTRLISVVDATASAGIQPGAVQELSNLEGVEWAFALGPAQDAVLPELESTTTGTPITARPIIGFLPKEFQTAGRLPRSGEALAGETAIQSLGIRDYSGAFSVSEQVHPVVGSFTASGPLENLNNTILTVPETDDTPIRYIYLRVATGYDVQSVADAVKAVLPASAPASVTVEVAAGAIELREALSGTLTESSRQLMLIVLGGGLALIAIAVSSAVSSRKRDFGRQRAIGATRSAIISLVLIQNAISGAIGSFLGTAVGLIITQLNYQQLPDWRFSVGVFILSLLVAVAGSLIPAFIASRRDPVSILRIA